MPWKKVKDKETPNLKDKLGNLNIADFYIYFANITKIFTQDYGFQKSVEENKPIDKNGNPLPLYTYPAIEYLNSLDFKNKKIFEFGSGNSTLFWIEKGAIVTCVENSKNWFESLKTSIPDPQKHQFIFANKEDYFNAITQNNEQYDVIIIDGSQNRLECSKKAVKQVTENGLIILENSDWFENSAKFIRDSLNFIQIDFYGFKPSKCNSSVTSFFISPKWKPTPLNNKKHPNFAIGGIQRQSQNDL